MSRHLTTPKAVATTLLASVACLLITPAFSQEPEPTTYVDAPAPYLTYWNDINVLTVGPDDPDGQTYIYPNNATKIADTLGDGTGSLAIIHWELDDGSGRAPGLQPVTDDFNFPTHNCIMASGERESLEFPGIFVPKTCSDPQGSSKRVFLEIQEADTPIDLTFNTGSRDIRYKGVQDPAEDGGAAFTAFRNEYGIGRIYRVIQKFINDTDERLVGVRVELGTGVGSDFTPLSLSDGVAYELRPFVDREFFVGNTGADDRAVWNEMRFAHFSPKMFDNGLRARFDPGFFDDDSAGLIPPQDFSTQGANNDKTQYIFSGDEISDTGRIGAITPNYFNIPETQGAGAGIPGTVFGYMLPDSLIPTVIDRHDDGNPESEGDAYEAWWDGTDWRYGLDKNFAIVPLDQLQQWAALLLGLDLPGVEDPTRYTSVASDDVSGLNMDTYIYLSDNLLGVGDSPYFNNGAPIHDTITVRYTAVSLSSLGLGDVPGSGDPDWIASPAPDLSTYMAATGVPVAINDSANTLRDESVSISILSNDLLDGAPLLDVGTIDSANFVTEPEHGIAELQPDNTVTYTPDVGFTGGDQFSYTVTAGGETSNTAYVALTVIKPSDPDVPIARNDSGTSIGTDTITIDVLSNDTVGIPEQPVDPATATVTINGEPTYGTATINTDNTVNYQANSVPSIPLIDYMTYTVNVDGAESNSALVIIRIDPPVIVEPIVPLSLGDTAEVTGSQPVTIDILDNDTWDAIAIPEGATISLLTSPANGNSVVNANQTVTYTANSGFSGSDQFDYSVNVDGNESNTSTVTVTVNPAIPVAANDTAVTTRAQAVTIDVLSNDSWDLTEMPARATISLPTPASSGSATINSDGTVEYTGGSIFVGEAFFDYSVTVDGVESNTATVAVTVNPTDVGGVDPEPTPSAGDADGSFFSCSIGTGGNAIVDPLFPATLALALAYIGLRRRGHATKI